MSTLTRDEILAMTAGCEMDELVAKRVLRLAVFDTFMGKFAHFPPYEGCRDPCGPLLSYSTDIAAAWEVVRQARGWDSHRQALFYIMLQSAVTCRLQICGSAPDATSLLLLLEPVDICKAALLLMAFLTPPEDE